MFVRGASSNTEIGTTNVASGNVSISFTTASAGSHGTASTGIVQFAEYTMSTVYGYTVGNANLTTGSHNHSLALGAPIDAAYAPPPNYKFPVVTCSSIKNVLPPYTIVFRKTAPSSLNFVKPTYYTDTAADKAHFRGHNSSYSFDPAIITTTGTSTSGGYHSHRNTNNGRPPSGGTASLWGFEQYGGAHTHAVSMTWRTYLKSKMLNGWVSPFEEAIEYGMIILYGGQPKDLPAGWRVCDGTLGTPDMRGYYLGGWYGQVSGSHDIVLASAHNAEVTSATIANNTFLHTHYGGNRNGDNAFNALHTNFSIDHNHGGGTGTATMNSFEPGTCNLAFIQYKGI
jgi:hypothetical protein